jgi:hypothetical protein
MADYTLLTRLDGSQAVIRSDGATIPMDPNNGDYRAYLARIEAGDTFPSQVETVPASRQMSPLAFRALFTADEMSAIQTAALSNADMLGWLLQMSAAQYIDLDDPLTKAGLSFLVSVGLLTSSRKTAILT